MTWWWSGIVFLLLGILTTAKYPVKTFAKSEAWRAPRVSDDATRWYGLIEFQEPWKIGSSESSDYLSRGSWLNLPVREHFLYEANGTRADARNVTYTGLPDRLRTDFTSGCETNAPHVVDLLDRGVGPKVLFGDRLDRDRVSYTSLHSYINHLREDLTPRVYCQGARSRKALFGSESNRRGFVEADNQCARACHEYVINNVIKTKRKLDIHHLMHEPFLAGCRVPVVTAFYGKLLKRKFNHGPTGSVQIPESTFNEALNLLGGDKSNLIDFLIHIQIEGQTTNYYYNPFSEIEHTDRSWLKSSAFEAGVARDSARDRLTLDQILKHGPPATTDDSDSLFYTYVPTIARYGSFRNGGRRLVNAQYTTPYPFYGMGRKSYREVEHPTVATDHGEQTAYNVPIDSYLEIRAASSFEFGGFAVNNFKWPTNTGYYADNLRIVEMPQPHEAIVDLGPTIRRVFDSRKFEFSLLSSATLVDADEDFVFHVARDWLYYIDRKSSCRQQKTSTECEYAKCNWCGRLLTSVDFTTPQASGRLLPLGSCGVPIDVCYLKGGYSSRVIRAP